jgi:ankyrin repeat protein
LIYASLYRHEEVVKVLLANGADVNFKPDTGLTALTAASMRGNNAIVKILQSKDTKPNLGLTKLLLISLIVVPFLLLVWWLMRKRTS